MATRDSADQPFEQASGLVPAGKPIERVLLPYEKELCDIIGCSTEEYKQFLFELERNAYVRPAEYAHIPDIRCDPATTSALISLAIGLVLSGVSYLLTPKPRAPEQQQTRQITRRGRTGQDRFIQSTNFDGFADLAEFGDAIPIVWTRYTGTTGGVVIAPLLTWSRAFSLGNQQAAKLVYLISESGLSAPDISGVFIGNTALSVQDADNYIFAWDARPSYDASRITGYNEGGVGFSACLTPSNSTQFGVSNPIANCTGYRVNWQVISYPEDLDEKAERDIRNQRLKVCGRPGRSAGMPGVGRDYPRRLGVIAAGKDQTGTTFRISGTRLPRKPSDFEKSTTITTEDINDALDAECIAADEVLQVGEQLVVGTQLLKVTGRSSQLWQRGSDVDIYLSAAVKGGPLSDIAANNAIADNENPSTRNYGVIYYSICRATTAVFRNNRRCQVTEIGIKSQVWGRINGLANFNRVPDPETLQGYDDDGVQFNLGNNNEYFPRVSMFRVQIRKVGQTSWGNVGGALAVRGGTPTDQHFQLRLNHGTDAEYEFRLKPISSAAIRDGLRELLVLNPNAEYVNDGILSFRGTREQIYANETSDELNPLFEARAMQTKGWGNAYASESYRIPTRATYFNMGVFSLTNVDYTGRLINVTDEQERLQRAFMYELFGDPLNLSQRKTADLKVKTDRGVVKLLLRVEAQDADPGTNVALRWRVRFAEIYEARPIEDSAFNVGQTIGIKVRLKTDSLYLDGKFPASIEDNRVELRMRLQITNTANKTLTPENRGWRLFETYAAFAEVSRYGNIVTHSCDSGPEHQVVYVNQTGGVALGDYSNVNTALLALRSNRNITSVDQLRLWIKSGTTNSNSFPRLVQYLLQNVKGISPQMIDTASFNEADSWCNANGLYYDGAITSRTNLRSFITSTAPFFLLNFVMRNGKLALLPALPGGGSAAMFTAGNIIEGSFSLEYLDISERRPIRAEMVWRRNLLNEFPQQQSFVLGSPGDTLESFDMSAFCTSESHARKAGNYILALRKFVTHAIRFKTTMDNASIGPGSIITVALNQTAASRFTNGSIGPTGVITTGQNLPNGTYPITYFISGNSTTLSGTLTVIGGRTTDAALFNSIFSITQENIVTSTYLVEQVELDEEGLVSVSATEYPYNAIASAAGL